MISKCTKLKYNDRDKNLTQKYRLLNYVEVKNDYTTATYSILSFIFTVDRGGDAKLRKFLTNGTPKQGIRFENFTPKLGD